MLPLGHAGIQHRLLLQHHHLCTTTLKKPKTKRAEPVVAPAVSFDTPKNLNWNDFDSRALCVCVSTVTSRVGVGFY